MIALALETSTRQGSVAICQGGKVLAESTFHVRATHSEAVLPAIARLIEESELERDRIEAVVVGAGPGSFTGVRIGAALAKGWASANRIPLFAFPSLAAVAASVGASRVCALFDARREQVYAAGYEDGAFDRASFGPEAVELAVLLGRIEPAAWSFAGEGATAYRSAIAAAGGRVLPEHLGVPRAAALAWLAHRFPDAGRVEAPEDWEPLYVRAPAAERSADGPPATNDPVG